MMQLESSMKFNDASDSYKTINESNIKRHQAPHAG